MAGTTSSGGMATAILGAVVGGVIVAAAGYFYLDRYLGIQPGLGARLAELEDSSGNVESINNEVADNTDQIGSLSDRMETLEEAISASTGENSDLGETQIQALQESLSDNAAAIASIRSNLNDLSARTPASSSTETEDALSASTAGIASRIDTIEAALNAESRAVTNLKEELTALSQNVADVKTDAESATASTNSSISGIGESVSALQSAMNEIETSTHSLTGEISTIKSDLAAQVTAFNEKIDETDKSLSAAEEQRGSLLAAAVAIGDIQSARFSGEPFEAAISTLAVSGKDEPNIQDAAKALTPYASEGLPTLQDLRDGLGQIREDLVARATSATDGGWLQQTEQNLTKLINPTSPNAMGSPHAATLSRAEEAFAAGDLSGAISDVRLIAADGMESAQFWVDQAEARVASDNTVKALENYIRNQLITSN
ncbi:MAG: hypothetical protein AAFY56_22045 [Pseudomonadota bacterium]